MYRKGLIMCKGILFMSTMINGRQQRFFCIPVCWGSHWIVYCGFYLVLLFLSTVSVVKPVLHSFFFFYYNHTGPDCYPIHLKCRQLILSEIKQKTFFPHQTSQPKPFTWPQTQTENRSLGNLISYQLTVFK